MSIATQIKRLRDVKQEIKEVVNEDFNKINDETIDKYPELINDTFDEYKSYIPYKHYEGEDISIDNNDNKEFRNLVVEGKTKQQTYSGKNLIKFTDPKSYPYENGVPTHPHSKNMVTSSDNNSFSITYTSNTFIGVVSDTMQLLPNTKYTISFNREQKTTFAQRIHFLNVSEDDVYSLKQAININAYGQPYSYTFTTNDTGKIAVMISVNNSSPSGENETITNIQVELGDQATSYEPYVGEVAAPNPDYPQEIKTVEGVRNLFDKDNLNIIKYANEITKLDNGIKVTCEDEGNFRWSAITLPNCDKLLGKTVTFSCDSYSNNNQHYAALLFFTSSTSAISNIYPNYTAIQYGRIEYTVTIPSSYPQGADRISILFYSSTSRIISVGDYTVFKNIQLEEGNIAHSYVPYGSNYLINKITGKNRFNPKIMSATKYGLTATINEDRSITIKGKVTSEWPWVIVTKNTISLYPSTPSQSGAISNDDNFINGTCHLKKYSEGIGVYGIQAYSKTSYIPTSSGEGTSTNGFNAIAIYCGQSGNDVDAVVRFQIEEGTQATDWEEYKENISYINLENTENLFNGILFNGYLDNGFFSSETWRTTDYIEVSPDTLYSFSANSTATRVLYEEYRDNQGNRIGGRRETTLNVSTLITTNETKYIRFSFNDTEINNLMICNGIYTTYFLARINDIYDELDMTTGKLTKRIGKLVLNGKEYGWDGENKSFYNIGFHNLFKNSGKCISSHFRHSNTVWSSNGHIGIAETQNLWVTLLDNHDNITLDEFKQWLLKNNLIIYFELKKPQIIQLTPTQVELFNDINNLTIEDKNNLQPNINAITISEDSYNKWKERG